MLIKTTNSVPAKLSYMGEDCPLPVSYSTLVTINGHLLAVGGRTPIEIRPRTYISTTRHHGLSLVKCQHLDHACLTAALPGNKLMVVGGDDTQRKCEIAKKERESN